MFSVVQKVKDPVDDIGIYACFLNVIRENVTRDSVKGGSRGRLRGVRTPPPFFSNATDILRK